MIAGTTLDAERVAALNHFMADVDALHVARAARDSVAELLARALHEPDAGRHWRGLYRAVRVLVAEASVQAQCSDAYRRMESFLAENADLDANTVEEHRPCYNLR